MSHYVVANGWCRLWWWQMAGIVGGNSQRVVYDSLGVQGQGIVVETHQRVVTTRWWWQMASVVVGDPNESQTWGCRLWWWQMAGVVGGNPQRVICDSLGVQGQGIVVVANGRRRGWKPPTSRLRLVGGAGARHLGGGKWPASWVETPQRIVCDSLGVQWPGIVDSW
jgi:hypothetical protein